MHNFPSLPQLEPGLEKRYHAALGRLPAREQADRGWWGLLLIFTGVQRLNSLLDAYFDYDLALFDIPRFQSEQAGYLSTAESYLATLAFHLYNPFSNHLPADGLAGLRGLDNRNFNLALTAIRLTCRRH